MLSLETKLVEHSEQKVEDLPADDILRVEVRDPAMGACGYLLGQGQGGHAGAMVKKGHSL